jgi:hypothetical protein
MLSPAFGLVPEPVAFYPSVELGVGGQAGAHLWIGVGDFGGVEAELFANGAAGFVVVLFGEGVVEEKLGLALRRVDFDGDCDGGAQKDAVLTRFGDEQIALFQGETLAEFGGNDEGSAFCPAWRCPYRISDTQNISTSENRNKIQLLWPSIRFLGIMTP